MSTQIMAAPRKRRLSLWPLLVFAVAIAVPLLPYYTNVSHFVLSMFMQATTYAIAVLGMVVVLGYTGQINLAQAAFFGFVRMAWPWARSAWVCRSGLRWR